jgi:ubiquinone/menaquinone biosynthesis C-methylase UbiE
MRPIDLNLTSGVKVTVMTNVDDLEPTAPNHHAHHPGFSGVTGLMAALSMLWRRDAMAETAIELTGAGAGDDVVDVGCGPGVAARLAAGAGMTVTGVDPAPVMLRVARVLDRRHRVSWLAGRVEDLPLPADAADVLWILSAIHHVPGIEAGLREVLRVLRPGGRLCVIERKVTPGATGLASHGWSPAQAETFADLARTAGFTNVAISSPALGTRPVLCVTARRP